MKDRLKTFEEALHDFETNVPETDLVHMFVPLMQEVAELHSQNKTANIHPSTIFEKPDGTLCLREPEGANMRSNSLGINMIQPKNESALNIIENTELARDINDNISFDNLDVLDTNEFKIEKPVYLNNYQSWETKLNHHDELTDVFSIGLLIAAAAFNLDLSDKKDLTSFTLNRRNLCKLNPNLHPAIATLIEGMTELNRHARESDLHLLSIKLLSYREYQGRYNAEHIVENIKEIPDRRTAILSTLRDRLFDLSKRNKLLYFKQSNSSVNMTEASVPLVMRIESIRKEQLCTWNTHVSEKILSGKAVSLNKWLRFEDQPFLPSALNRLITQSRRDKSEYGFSSLRLVVAHLNWYNLKDAPEEKIKSPLLWLPVNLKKKKGVRDHFILQCDESEAEFNPVLRHYFKQLYDIELPEQVDLAKNSVEQIHESLAEQIAQSEPDVKLAFNKNPSIRLIHERAVKRLRKFEKRRNKRKTKTNNFGNFSYDKENYRPLGFSIFKQNIMRRVLPQRSALGITSSHVPQYITNSANNSSTGANTYYLDSADKGKYGWNIDLAELTLVNFNYRKMSLVRDYSALIEKAAEITSLDSLFSIVPRQEKEKLPDALPLHQQWNVVASDMTQDQAVSLAREGTSFIIQGPPGTGKSQTITNLISDFAANGKRILFVCEKRAALDVVFNRLKQAGLEKLATIIHDIQEDKKEFIHDLKAVYETWLENKVAVEQNKAERERTLNAFTTYFSEIEKLEGLLGKTDPEAANNFRSLIKSAIELPEVEDDYDVTTRQKLPTLANWLQENTLAKHIQTNLQTHFGLSSLCESVFSQLNEKIIMTEDVSKSFKQIQHTIVTSDNLSDDITILQEHLDEILDENHSLTTLLELASFATKACDLNLHNNLPLFDDKSKDSAELATYLAEIQQKSDNFEAADKNTVNWNRPLSEQDTRTALSIAKRQESSIFRIFSSDWRALKNTMTSGYNFEAHSVKPSIINVLEQLTEKYETLSELQQTEKKISSKLQTESVLELSSFIEEVRLKARSNQTLKSLIESHNCKHLLEILVNNLPTIRNFHEVADELLDSSTALENHEKQDSLSDKQSLIREMRESLEDLPVVLPLLHASYSVQADVGYVLRNIQGSVSQMTALVTNETLKRMLVTRPELMNYSIDKLISFSKRSAKARQIILGQNANFIINQRHHLFQQHVQQSSMSISQLGEDERRFKKHYTTGRREVEHEFSKRMRYRSIRDMASDETGAIVSDLKPIWLMSPLSVSDTLPLDFSLFDVVIFDEASQIPVEDAIPALCRAPQLIVVGDEMQLPPTSFFSSSVDEEDIEIEVQEEGELLSVTLDADSLLSQAARHLPATLLAWHYRSRSESLISFSNAAFYDGRLVTIPDQKRIDVKSQNMQRKQIDHPSNDEEEASKQILGDIELQELLSKPITFRFIQSGIYEKRANIGEAKKIADTLRALLSSKSNLSVGIVAFSEAQQTCIEEAIDTLAEEDEKFASLVEDEYQREDDGQFNGLFIKNLENVQGDERDIIILSICYAPNSSGKMLMNFGPINQRGGEKRLNVIFSRARQHMVVVSSIKSSAITNTHNDGAFALKTFLAFAEAQDAGRIKASRQALASVNPAVLEVFNGELPYDPLRKAIANALRSRGHIVHEYVGSASFRCDLAIVDPVTQHYSLGILLDHDLESLDTKAQGDKALSKNLIFERFVFKPSILRNFGWKIIDVFSSAWHNSPEQVIEDIQHALVNEKMHDELTEEELFENIALPTFENSIGTLLPNDNLITSHETTTQNNFTRLEFTQGNSNKFWQIAQEQTSLIIQYGRLGTKGQTLRKSFGDEQITQKQMNKLIGEKIRKGYKEL